MTGIERGTPASIHQAAASETEPTVKNQQDAGEANAPPVVPLGLDGLRPRPAGRSPAASAPDPRSSGSVEWFRAAGGGEAGIERGYAGGVDFSQPPQRARLPGWISEKYAPLDAIDGGGEYPVDARELP